MPDIKLQNSYIRFFSCLVTTFRKISLYPLAHPSISSSMNEVYVSLQQILFTKNLLSLNISPENKIIINDEEISDKDLLTSGPFISYLKKLNVENVSFNAGITQKETEAFIRILLFGQEKLKTIEDINKHLLDNAIEHIKIEQISYVKIKKGQEALILEKKSAFLEKLKTKIRDYCTDKIKEAEEVNQLEDEILDTVIAEFQEKKVIGTPLRNIFKKFLLHHKNSKDALQKLKSTLLDLGFPAQEIDNLMRKIEAGIKEKPKAEVQQALLKEEQEFSKKSQGLTQQIRELKGELETKVTLLKQLEKQNQLIMGEKERIDNIIHHMADGMLAIGPQGNILMANPTAESLLGITKQDIGKPIKEVIKDEHILALVKSIPQDQEGVIEKDIELFSPNETTKRIVRTSSAVVEDQNGKTVGMVTILNDITKQKEIEKLKSDFLANVSHELRTPLVAMEKSISLILSKNAGEISQQQEQFLAIAQRNLSRLTLLINDLLDLSKFEAGKIQLKREFASLEKVIAESVETLRTWAETKSIVIHKKITPGLPEVNIDFNKIIQVLNNLISNAIKFTPREGAITIEAGLKSGVQEIEISVQDTGIGISEENLKKIFDKFYQIGELTTEGIASTGIGLSIVKEIVELHSGKVWVESLKGQGTKFSFTLPI